MKVIKAKLGLSRAGMGSDSYMRMEIEDATSGIRFCELEIGMYDYAFLTTGLHGVSAKCTLRGLEDVGKSVEGTQDIIPRPADTPEAIQAALAPYEVDGSKAYPPDLFNHPHAVEGGQSAIFHQYVVATEYSLGVYVH